MMNNSTVNFTRLKASSNSTAYSVGLMEILELSLCSFSFLFGLPTNFYVIWLIVTGTGSGVASEFFILNLSVCETGIYLLCLFDTVSIWFSQVKRLSQFLQDLAVTGRPLCQCLICVERYLAVVHPVTFLKYKPLRYRLICCTVAWVITLSSCLYCMFILIMHNTTAHSLFYSLQFILFLSIQLFCLVAVLRALKQSGPGERGREREEENHMKRRAFNLIVITTVNTVVIYVPFTISGFFIVVTQQRSKALFFTGLVCYALGGFVQPALYLRRTGKLSRFCNP